MDNLELVKHLLNKQYEVVGLNFDQVQEGLKAEDTKWFTADESRKITDAQRDEWKQWAVKELRRIRRWGVKLAEMEIAWLDCQCGLSHKQENEVDK